MLLLRVREHNSARAIGGTHHTTGTRGLTPRLPSHTRYVHPTPCKIPHDETSAANREVLQWPICTTEWFGQAHKACHTELWAMHRLVHPLKEKHYHFEQLVFSVVVLMWSAATAILWGKSFIVLTVYTNLFICRIVRLPVVTLLITKEAGKEHSACSRRREMSILYIWKSFKTKLEEEISKDKYMHTELKCAVYLN